MNIKEPYHSDVYQQRLLGLLTQSLCLDGASGRQAVKGEAGKYAPSCRDKMDE